MRTMTAQEISTRATGTAATWVRVDLDRDGAGTWQDMGTLSGYDWLIDASYRESVDDPVASATVTLWREQGPLSLSPFMESSPLNIVSGTYTPMIDVNRRLRIYTATMPHMIAPTSTDWRLVFDGLIDDFDAGGKDCSIKLQCRDLGARLQDGFIEADDVYGTDAGASVESQMQAILTNCYAAGSIPVAVTLYTPVSPGWNIYKYAQAKASVLDAIRTLAQQNGWDVRYKWRSATSQFELTFYSPDRAKTTPDLTLGPGQYYLMPQARLSCVDVRNAERIEYTNRTTGLRSSVTVTDAASISRFGRRLIIIGEASTGNIQSAAEATAMANAVLSDLKDPLLNATADTPYNYAVEVGDLIRFSANGVQIDTDKDLAVVSIDHKLGMDGCQTSLGLRGKPSGGYERWLSLEIRGGIKPSSYVDATLTPATDFTLSDPDYAAISPFVFAISDDSSQLNTSTGVITVRDTGLYEISVVAAIVSSSATPVSMGYLTIAWSFMGSGVGSQTARAYSLVSGVERYISNDVRVMLMSGMAVQVFFGRYLTDPPGCSVTLLSDEAKTHFRIRKIE